MGILVKFAYNINTLTIMANPVPHQWRNKLPYPRLGASGGSTGSFSVKGSDITGEQYQDGRFVGKTSFPVFYGGIGFLDEGVQYTIDPLAGAVDFSGLGFAPGDSDIITFVF